MSLTLEQHNSMRESLLKSAVSVVANKGLEFMATRDIGNACNISDAYIYRYFANKDDLLVKAFEKYDANLIELIKSRSIHLKMNGLSLETRCWSFFSDCWDFIMNDREATTFYMRYFYSASFERYASSEYKKRHKDLISELLPYLKNDCNPKILLSTVFRTLFDAAGQVLQGNLENDEEVKQNVFKLIFGIVSPYML